MTDIVAPSPIDLRRVGSAYLRDEADCMRDAREQARLSDADRAQVTAAAQALVTQIRAQKRRLAPIDALLQEYGLSTTEGITLMRLAEALIRTSDRPTAYALLRDKIADGAWGQHIGESPSPLVNSATIGLGFSKGWVEFTGGEEARHLIARLGDRVLFSAVSRAMTMMAHHFVLGNTIQVATKKAVEVARQGYHFSYDMLGEAAKTNAQAYAYHQAYLDAAQHLAQQVKTPVDLTEAPGLSVKLSALHPRYEYAQKAHCIPVLVKRVLEICQIAKAANIGVSLDAEEADRLEISLEIFEQLLKAPELEGWDGLGLVVQAYQRRALSVIDWSVTKSRQANRNIMMRLVKGAYWDSEIKRAQEMGLESYPVFTRKENTDISFLACARKMLDAKDVIYSQFATHNARTAMSVIHMAGDVDFELQRLHGMGDDLHQNLIRSRNIRSRVYAPVGRHEDLLPYLVRRLLENGANSSFVNQLFDEDVSVEELVKDPIMELDQSEQIANPKIPPPTDHLQNGRAVAGGVDWTQADRVDTFNQFISDINFNSPKIPGQAVTAPFNPDLILGYSEQHTPDDVNQAIAKLDPSNWVKTDVTARAEVLRRLADSLEANTTQLTQLCVFEAGKTWPDAIAEIREAVDFCRYYADQAEALGNRTPIGIIGCISPWNFPLAIFLGQVVASLAAGNCVIAKPAPQTPLIAQFTTDLIYKTGIPDDAFQLITGEGAALGEAITRHPNVNGVCFTGSTKTAKLIAKAITETERADIPLIAETGGINAMIVDSTALLEQVVTDVTTSAFQSAGQRCSACRLVCIQDEIADDFIEMLAGAMALLRVGPPTQLDNDIGPVIDANAHQSLSQYIQQAHRQFKFIAAAPMPDGLPERAYIPPTAFEISSISDLSHEVFGPVLHVMRFKSKYFDQLVNKINSMGYGLTMGLHTRIDTRMERVATQARVGNLYINRNQIGAVVGVQPFGGEGLSGTGPKAGGPFYLRRLTRPQKSRDVKTAPQDLPPLSLPLPGPTGELNSLALHPRGTVLCLGGPQPNDLTRQIECALYFGNRVLTPAGDMPNTQQVDMTQIEKHMPDIDAVAIDGPEKVAWAARLNLAQGPLRPVLSADDDPERYAVERTVTIDTTAAGGNASLLAQG